MPARSSTAHEIGESDASREYDVNSRSWARGQMVIAVFSCAARRSVEF